LSCPETYGGSGGARPARTGTNLLPPRFPGTEEEISMNAIIYLVGLVVVVMFILSVIGLR
jgi:hypothetical protein